MLGASLQRGRSRANADLAKAVVNPQLMLCGRNLWLPSNSGGTFHKIIFPSAPRRFLAIGFFETIGAAWANQRRSVLPVPEVHELFCSVAF
jgi:hypothetical protein